MRPESLVGAVVAGKYRIERVLGQGGMGIVYEAENVVLGRRVALKRLRDAAQHDAGLVARFLQEARAAAAIGDEHIVDILDVISDESGVIWIVMELLTGESLATRLAVERRLTPEVATEVVAQMLEALQAAHARGIVHRDLKPENLWLSRRADGQLFVKLLDFGISKVLDGSLRGSGDKLTTTGVMMGTAHYMSPEQARGKSEVDHRTDLWSAGALLFECLAGRTPFEEPSYNAMIAKLLTEEPPDLRTLSPEVPEPLAAVVRRAMTKDPTARFQSAAEMRAALLGQPLDPPPPPGPRVRIDSEPLGMRPSALPEIGTADTSIDARTPAPTPFSGESIPPAPARRPPALVLAIGLVLAAGMTVLVLGRGGRDARVHGAPPAHDPRPPRAVVDAGARPATRDGGARAPAHDDAGATPPAAARTLRVVVTSPPRGARIAIGAEERPGPSATFSVGPGPGAVTVVVSAPGHRTRRIEHDPAQGELVVALERVTGSRPGIDEDNPYRRGAPR